MTSGTQRACTVRLLKQESPASVFPIEGVPDASEMEETESEAMEEGADMNGEAEEWRERVEELSKRVAQHFEDTHEKDAVSPPGVKAPPTTYARRMGTASGYPHAIQGMVPTLCGGTCSKASAPKTGKEWTHSTRRRWPQRWPNQNFNRLYVSA